MAASYLNPVYPCFAMSTHQKSSFSTVFNNLFSISSTDANKSDIDAFKRALDDLQEGIALFDNEGELIYQNSIYGELDLPSGLQIREQYLTSLTGTLRVPQNITYSVSVHVSHTPIGFCVFTEKAVDRLSLRDKLLQNLMKPLHEDETIYARAARALGLASHWRWVGVSKYLKEDGSEVSFEGWWDNAGVNPPFKLSTVGTACEIVANTEEFCYYTGHENLKQRFPDWELVDTLNMHCYTGLVYRIDGKPVGHVIAISDTPTMDSTVMEDLLRLATGFVGMQLEIEKQSSEAERNHKMARCDELTGLGNRLAFNETMSKLVNQLKSRKIDDILVVNIDLDGLKAINDSEGHDIGDKLITSYAEVLRKLWRPTDYYFRHGGDEFSLLIPSIKPNQLSLVEERMQASSDSLKQIVNEKAGASYGLCFLSETNGDHEAACKLADRRMYEMKNMRSKAA